METRQAVIQTLKLLRANFHAGNKQISVDEDMIELWHYALSKLSDSEIASGLERILTEKKDGFFPTTGEFVDFARANPEYASLEEEAQIAFGELRTALVRHAYKNIAFKNVAIANFIRSQGGWSTAIQWTEEDLIWKRKAFIDEYESLKRQKGSCWLRAPKGFKELAFVGNFSESEKSLMIEARQSERKALTSVGNELGLKLIAGGKA